MIKNLIKKTNKPLREASQGQYFWVCDGQVLKNLQELVQALDKMTVQTFAYHVNKAKNDFANWVADVLLEKKLGADLRKVKTAKQMAQKIRTAL